MGPKKLRFVRRLKSYFHEYCQSTSIHGFKYFGEKRTYIDLGWWIIIFLMCLSCCAYFITMVYKKWESSPVIVSFATKETPIYKIPFPAVTICPETKALKEFYNHSEIVSKLWMDEKLTEEEYRNVSYMNLLCDFNITRDLELMYNSTFHNTTFDNYYYSNDEFFDFMFNVSGNILENFVVCRWMNKPYNCQEIFELVITDEGVCATFNMLDNSRIFKDNVYFQDIPYAIKKPPKNVTWNLDDGYKKHEDLYTFPRRALYAGAKNALSIMIEVRNKDLDHTCKLSLQGFKVTLHTPMRVPRPSQQYFRLPLNEAVISAVQPVMITTSDTVKVFKPEKRECYFPNEKQLKYFKVYTQKNCKLECLTDFTYYWCWCVGFFMPRNKGTDICGSLSKSCMEEAEEILQKGHLSNMLGLKPKKRNFNTTSEPVDTEEIEIPECDCLPLCTDLSYDIETSATNWDWRHIPATLIPNYTQDLDAREDLQTSMSHLIIYFKNTQFVTSKRHELYGPTDFLGNFGGLLGLFTGFSVLSLMEIIYFLTVRIICNIKLYGNWSGTEKDVEKNL